MTANKLRASMVAALLALAALTAAPAFAAKLGTKTNNDLAAAQKAQKAGDAAAMKAALDKAAVDASSDYDKYMAAFIAASLAAQTNDLATAGVQAELAGDSAYLASADATPEDKTNGYRIALILAYNSKHYDKAKVYAKGLEVTNPTDPALINTMIQAYALGGDSASAKALVNKRIAAMGGKPDRAALQAMLNINVADKDEAAAEETLEKIVANFGDPKDWSQLIDVAISTKGLRDVELIWLGRLMFVTGSTPSAQDLRLVGDTASHLAFYGDALMAQQHGGKDFSDPTAKAEADKKTIQAQIAAVPKQNGNYAAKLAEALYSYGMYAEAESAANAAMAKGGVPDASEAPMVLGQALAAQGKYDDALAAFGKVTGGGPATARITRLWVDHVNLKKNPPAAETAAAAPAKK